MIYGVTREYFRSRAFSPIAVLAVLSVLALAATVSWKIASKYAPSGASTVAESIQPQVVLPDVTHTNWQAPPSTLASVDASGTPMDFGSASSSDRDGIGNIAGNVVNTLLNSYDTLQQAGTYSTTTGTLVAENIAANLKASISYAQIAATDIKTTNDTSRAGMLTYRSAMQTALKPLIKNDEAEYVTFAKYIDSSNPKYLQTLRDDAVNYRAAATLAEKVVVPTDAVSYHVAVVNSLNAFATTLDDLAQYADDPFAGAAILRTYTDNEQNVFASFSSLASYYRSKAS